ncbi:hypothetical protein [Clostridium sp. 1001283B150210_160208_E6]|jgi:hypothetical protein|uniref:Uncharacterized protein n=1 Tax=Siphoviridae sp. cteLh2 TaxID=2825590 RepID=A0A8S5U5U3_9CAUD|nr:hypothetical protein [Clostridium sp. 1001283B150210_160208_E6]DAF89826.1 MAG TPA: hypothetical protein [Siphoviridae sp. cteLh2]
MITVKDFLDLNPHKTELKHKKLAFTYFTKEFTLNNPEYIEYAEVVYTNSEGLELCIEDKKYADIVKVLEDIIIDNKLSLDEPIVTWDIDDGDIINFNGMVELEDCLLFYVR